MTVDRIHRVPKSLFLHMHVPRDVLCIHFYQAKEKLLDVFRKQEHLPEQEAASRYFLISQHILCVIGNTWTLSRRPCRTIQFVFNRNTGPSLSLFAMAPLLLLCRGHSFTELMGHFPNSLLCSIHKCSSYAISGGLAGGDLYVFF